MAVAGIGIERHVAEERRSRGTSFLIARIARQTRLSGIERLGAVFVAARRIGIGKERETGNRQLGGARGGVHGLVDREPLYSGHRGHRSADLMAIDQEQRPDQVVGGEHVLAHEPPRPIGAAVAPRADRPDRAARARLRPARSSDVRARKRGSGRGAAACNRSAKFDRHDRMLPLARFRPAAPFSPSNPEPPLAIRWPQAARLYRR